MMKWMFGALSFALLGVGAAQAATEKALVAGGCFWCVESDFESVPGVKSVVSGYTGGKTKDPTYKQVGAGGTGHYESALISFDNSKISYTQIMDLFFHSIDPTDGGGQFCDRGDSYRSAVFAMNPAQKAAAEAAKVAVGKELGKPIATRIVTAGPFYQAEAYHQNYYKGDSIVLTRRGPKRQSEAYKFYRNACGRDARTKQLFGTKAAFSH